MDAKTEKQLTDLWLECDATRRALIDNLENGKKLGHIAEPVRREINETVIGIYRRFQDALNDIIDAED